MENKNLFSEIVRLIEMGINRHLNRSFLYSPFRLFFNLFKKSNPQLINRVRQMVAEDLGECIKSIEHFDETLLFQYGQPTKLGSELMKRCYNIGIRLLKKDLNVRLAFKAIRDRDLQEKIYNHILEQVQEAVMKIIKPAVAYKQQAVEGEVIHDKNAN